MIRRCHNEKIYLDSGNTLNMYSTPLTSASTTPTITQTSSIIYTNTPTPTLSITPTITTTPSYTQTPTVTPSITPTITTTPSYTQTPTVTPSITPTITTTPSYTQTPTVTPSITPTRTTTPTASSEPIVLVPPILVYGQQTLYVCNINDVSVTFELQKSTDSGVSWSVFSESPLLVSVLSSNNNYKLFDYNYNSSGMLFRIRAIYQNIISDWNINYIYSTGNLLPPTLNVYNNYINVNNTNNQNVWIQVQSSNNGGTWHDIASNIDMGVYPVSAGGYRSVYNYLYIRARLWGQTSGIYVSDWGYSQ